MVAKLILNWSAAGLIISWCQVQLDIRKRDGLGKWRTTFGGKEERETEFQRDGDDFASTDYQKNWGPVLIANYCDASVITRKMFQSARTTIKLKDCVPNWGSRTWNEISRLLRFRWLTLSFSHFGHKNNPEESKSEVDVKILSKVYPYGQPYFPPQRLHLKVALKVIDKNASNNQRQKDSWQPISSFQAANKHSTKLCKQR